MPSNAPARPKPARRPRYRYVLFRIEGAAPTRAAFLESLRRAQTARGDLDPDRMWLTRFDGAWGVLRTPRGQEAEGIRLLQEGLGAQRIEARPLRTSGTLAALERHHPHLRRLRRRP